MTEIVRENIDDSLSMSTMYKFYVINKNQNRKEFILQYIYYDVLLLKFLFIFCFYIIIILDYFNPKKINARYLWVRQISTTEEKKASREDYDVHIMAKE